MSLDNFSPILPPADDLPASKPAEQGSLAPTPHQPGFLTKRRVRTLALSVLALGLSIGAVAATKSRNTTLTQYGIGELSGLQSGLDAEIKRLLPEYAKTGVLPEEALCRQLFLRREWILFLTRERGEPYGSFEDFENKHYEPFAARIFERFRADGQENKVKSPLLRLKKAFHDEAGNTYNKDSNTVADPVMNKKLQCSSGCRSFLLLALREQAERPFLHAGEVLVEIYTEGHVFPGLLSPDGNLIGLEMTTTGDGVKNLGSIHSISTPLRVVRADHGLFQTALGVSSHQQGVILLDTVNKGDFQEKSDAEKTSGVNLFSFGVPHVPPGDQSMIEINRFPERSAGYSAPSQPTDEGLKLVREVSNSHQRALVENYLQLDQFVVDFWNLHTDLVNPLFLNPEGYDLLSYSESFQKLLVVLREFEEFNFANNAEQRYQDANRIFALYHLRMKHKSPDAMAKAMTNNIGVIQKKLNQKRGR